MYPTNVLYKPQKFARKPRNSSWKLEINDIFDTSAQKVLSEHQVWKSSWISNDSNRFHQFMRIFSIQILTH